MGLLDSLVKKAQEKLEEQAENVAKKLNAIPANIIEAIEPPKAAKAKTPKQNKLAQHKYKADTSIEGISKQILAQLDSLRRNGFKEYEYIANKNCCKICAELNGKHFKTSALKIGVNAPPMHEGCTCSISAYEDEEAYNEWLSKF